MLSNDNWRSLSTVIQYTPDALRGAFRADDEDQGRDQHFYCHSPSRSARSLVSSRQLANNGVPCSPAAFNDIQHLTRSMPADGLEAQDVVPPRCGCWVAHKPSICRHFHMRGPLAVWRCVAKPVLATAGADYARHWRGYIASLCAPRALVGAVRTLENAVSEYCRLFCSG